MKTSFLALLLSALAGASALPAALGTMQVNVSDTIANDTGAAAGNETTTANNMTTTAAVNETTTANVTGANETTAAGTNETNNVNVTITPFAQKPGGSVILEAEGLEPNTNATITVDNELAAKTQSDGNGTLLYGLGVPSEPITHTTIKVDESGRETIDNDTHAWEGTVRVVVEDEAGNSGSGELTVLAPVSGGESNQTAGLDIPRETLDRFLD